MTFSSENLKKRERFLTREFAAMLAARADVGDPFTTGTADYPKAFRIGECTVVSTDRTKLQLLLFWRDDVRNEQKEISVEAARTGDGWLVDKIVN